MGFRFLPFTLPLFAVGLVILALACAKGDSGKGPATSDASAAGSDAFSVEGHCDH